METILKSIESGEEDLLTDRGEVWYGNNRTNRATLNRLLWLALVKSDPLSDCRYIITEDGRACLHDRKYVPRMVPLLAEALRRTKSKAI